MSETGRYFIRSGNRTFCIEPIDNTLGKGKRQWGDVNPATKEVEGNFGNKSVGAIHEKDSIITEENGVKNIETLPAGKSPEGYIEYLTKNRIGV